MATVVHTFSPHAIADAFGVLDHVVKVFVNLQGRSVSVWTVVDSFDRDVRDRIYSAERNLFQAFPEYKFDFRLIEGNEETSISEAKLVYSRS